MKDINVLWIDDKKEEFRDSYQQIADSYGITLVDFSNWEEAAKYLENNIQEISAIILDAECFPRKDSKAASHMFLAEAVPSMTTIFGSKHRYVPWFVLSAGTMMNFNYIIEVAQAARKELEPEWGPLLYKKTAPDDDPLCMDKLFEKIVELSENQSLNVVRFRHYNVFKFVGEGKLIDFPEARTILGKMLGALYFPEENNGYEYEGNPLRRVVEYMFRAAYGLNLLPECCFKGLNGNDDEQKKVTLTWGSLFLSGKVLQCKEDGKTYKWIGDEIFSPIQSLQLKAILDYTNRKSHTTERKYFINIDEKEEFFSYVLLLCHIIKAFGTFAENHSDDAENLMKISSREIKDTSVH